MFFLNRKHSYSIDFVVLCVARKGVETMASKQKVTGNLAVSEQQRVIVIEATEKPQDLKLRVAAYTRVSSDSADQLNSFAAQNRYYTALISSKENWTMVDIYADRGITGTSVEKRDDFQRLISDCRRGLIDRVLCKSISRFARNTTDCLEAIRELKSLGIGITFEKEHIDTAKVSGEMLTALFAAMAQAESESISRNSSLGVQMRMKSGTFNTCKNPFGYRLNGNKPEIYEPEAKLVREIFSQFLNGWSCDEIAEYINGLNIPTRDGNTVWRHSTIKYILQNERYAGNALLQKNYSTDTLPRQKKRNRGERQQYYVAGSNPPIISVETFEAAKALILRRRAKTGTSPRRKKALSVLRCGCCGGTFRQKTCGGKVYWACLTHDRTHDSCPIIQIPESEIHTAFLRLYYNLKHHGDQLLPPFLADLQMIRSHHLLWSVDVIELNKQISNLTSQNQLLAMLKQQGGVDPDIFISRSNELSEQLRAVKREKRRLLNAEGDDTIVQTQELTEIVDAGPDFLESFDEELFGELVEKIIVESNDRLRFRLRNGLELAETIERTVR